MNTKHFGYSQKINDPAFAGSSGDFINKYILRFLKQN